MNERMGKPKATGPPNLESSKLGGICLCSGFTAQSTQWGHIKQIRLPKHTFSWAGLVL